MPPTRDDSGTGKRQPTVKSDGSRGSRSARPFLWQHVNTGYWYIVYIAHDGRRHRKTTGTRDKTEALEQLQRLQGILASVPKPQNPTIGSILDGYEATKRDTVASPSTMIYTLRPLRAFFGTLLPEDISTPLLKRYALQRGRKPATIAREVQILRAALRWAQAERWITAAPIVTMPVKGTPPRDRWLTREEADKLIASCDAPHVRLFVILALNTAKRSGAILSLRWEAIRDDMADFGAAVGNKRRGAVPLNGAALAALREARERAVSPYVIERGGDRIRSVKTGFRAACRRAGLEKVMPHVLRRTAATWAAMAGVPMDEIARLLGDSITVTEKHYARFHPSYLRRAVDALQRSDKHSLKSG